MSIAEICHHHPVTMRAIDELTQAAQLMREKHIGYIVVVEPEPQGAGVRPVGVLTDRDIVIEVVASGAEAKLLKVGDVMTVPAVTISESASSSVALAEMRRIGVRRMPVLGTRGQLVGVLSLDDLIGSLARDLHEVSGSIMNQQRIEGALRL